MKKLTILFSMMMILGVFCLSVQAQTSGFSYQGRFTDSTLPQPTNGTYAMQFALFDAVSGGTQIGATVTNPTVQVVNGVFTVNLDFGASSFDGAARFLEITVSSVVLSPRQAISSAPYSIRSLNATTADNATNLGGVTANQFVQNNDTRLSDDRNPTAGSTNYIQNGTTPQTGNLNISGNGTVGGTLTAATVSGGIVNATNQFNLNGARFLSNAGNSNIFAGENVALTNVSGSFNSFFGARAGRFNLSGNGNVFVGNDTGLNNFTGSSNTLIGSGASVSADGLNFATAIGSLATVSDSNSVVLGRAVDTVRIPGNLNVTGTFTGSFTVPTTNLTGVVNVANGGTGLSATGAAGNFLRSNGTTWTSAPIQLGDLPNLGNSFIQNGTTQQSGDFNIDGNGVLGGDLTANNLIVNGINADIIAANIISATTISATAPIDAPAYQINSNRVLSNAGINNLFAGVIAGQNNTTGDSNAFFGFNSGFGNTTGSENSFFGSRAGASNEAASFNAFFGTDAGGENEGSFNTFMGRQAGFFNTTGSGNVFVGNDTGVNNLTGSSNTLVGSGANMSSDGLNFATAIGAGATVSGSNSITLGRTNGLDSVSMPGGMGGSLSLNGNTLFLRANNNFNSTIVTNSTDVSFNSPSLFIWSVPLIGARMFLQSTGNLSIAGSYSQFSDFRYKTNINTYAGGLEAIMRLRGVTYNWKPELNKDSRLQIGFIAQEVETVLPELVMTDENGFKSVSYANAVPVLVEAIKEQQTQIEAQQKQIEAQQKQIEELKQIVCAANPNAGLCKEQK